MRSDGEDVKTVAWVAPTDLGAMQKALVDAGDCTANLVHEPMMLVECGDEDLEKNGCGPTEEVDDTVEHNRGPLRAAIGSIGVVGGKPATVGSVGGAGRVSPPSETEPRGDDAPSSLEPPRAGTAAPRRGP